MSKLWEVEVLSITYVRADTKEEAEREYNYGLCADSSDNIQSIKEVKEEDALFVVECPNSEEIQEDLE